ncbi:MAG: host-nuclease inhibitor Gam family protein [Burkholderiaceae bacterium]|nr:host-nuclease inhibitor Gam family protein [Burkholderiaceae bacterium]
MTTPVPQNRDDCAAYIRTLGDLQREFERQRADMNDRIAEITNAAQPVLAGLTERIDALRTGIQTWCEANRVALCGEGDRLGKTVNLVTGEVSWRQVPPSVQVRGAEAVLDRLAVMGLDRFIRTRAEVNKEAILAEPDAARGVPGLTIVTGLENFSITPFEAAAEVAA